MQLVKQMARYMNAEYANVNFISGLCYGNALAAAWEFELWCLEQRQPDRHIFQAMHHNLRKTGTLMPAAHVGRSRQDVDCENMLVSLLIHPNICYII
jgi:hypothetical protein